MTFLLTFTTCCSLHLLYSLGLFVFSLDTLITLAEPVLAFLIVLEHRKVRPPNSRLDPVKHQKLTDLNFARYSDLIKEDMMLINDSV